VNKLKKNDNVIVTKGKDKGKTGKVLIILKKENKAIVEKINIVKRHRKPTQNHKGGIVEMPAPIQLSNLKILCPETNKPTRIKIVKTENKGKRKALVSGAMFD
jgi:large subunit ribosomal protein L24